MDRWLKRVLLVGCVAASTWVAIALFVDFHQDRLKFAWKDPHVFVPAILDIALVLLYRYWAAREGAIERLRVELPELRVLYPNKVNYELNKTVEEIQRKILTELKGFPADRPVRLPKPPGASGPKAAERKKKREPILDPEQPRPGSPRFPAAAFFTVSRANVTEIPEDQPLPPVPTPPERLEFRFWIDTAKKGIRPRGETPSIHPPVKFPIDLLVTVWSEDFRFTSYEEKLILKAEGVSKHTKFPIETLPVPYTRGELFVFVRYEGDLVAVLRVEALVADDPDNRPSQVLEYVYLATNWFDFSVPGDSDLRAILLTKKQDNLRIFTLTGKGAPWVAVGHSVSDLYQHNKAIYRELQRVALAAAEAENRGKKLSFAREFGQLAESGYQLFTDIFFSGDDTRAVELNDKYLSRLSEGARLVIVISKELQNLCLPWGLLYDRRPPFGLSESPERGAFWGYRYNIVVRPWITPVGVAGSTRLPVRLGAAWLDHTETQQLRVELSSLGEPLKLEDVRVANYSIPALAEQPFDLIEFFCHGHTHLGEVFTASEEREIVDDYKKSGIQKNTKRSLLMAINSSKDSLVELNGGYATLATLSQTLGNGMRGAPIILLSMCESAQVSCSGSGFLNLFLRRGARAVVGTEGPALWSLSRAMDTGIIRELMGGATISQAFFNTRRKLADESMLSLIYTLYGDPDARLVETAGKPSENGVIC